MFAPLFFTMEICGMFLGVYVQRQGEARPTLTHREGVRLTDSATPGSLCKCVLVCACMCTEMPGSWVNRGEKVVPTDGAAHPETLQGASICQLPWCSPLLRPRFPLRQLRLSSTKRPVCA